MPLVERERWTNVPGTGTYYLSTEIENGRVFSERLHLEMVRDGKDFRLFDPATREFLLTLEQSETKRLAAEGRINRLEAEIERLKRR